LALFAKQIMQRHFNQYQKFFSFSSIPYAAQISRLHVLYFVFYPLCCSNKAPNIYCVSKKFSAAFFSSSFISLYGSNKVPIFIAKREIQHRFDPYEKFSVPF
jgi:hypothetical protein